ncbi:hypothetical protein [Paenibacillus sp. LHD-38]|uniref:hypothetical protein n=1 Tax=Paenibacillus sp. LHD-38 TaxID=3072143 RepID=UPI00280FF0C0|nr:hypothetical protein [Paenibacillus sp. LHD-38]MDQ8735803.1 hypothetical protein [Paenibacillus sp. LHD-38]
MQVRKRVDKSGVTRIHLLENIVFTSDKYDDLKKTFNSYKEYGVIIANSFEDVEWRYVSTVHNVPLKLLYDLEVYKDLNLALKAFTLARIINNTAADTVWLEQRYLKRAILETNGFMNTSNLDALLLSVSAPEASRLARTIIMFSTFYSIPNIDRVREICESRPNKVHGSRKLPDFQHVMTFDKYIDAYFNEFPDSDTKTLFLPILLWWRITNILPMRPNEFLKLRSDCIERDHNNLFWIRKPIIKESNVERDGGEETGYTRVQIDESTYSMIRDYSIKLELSGIVSEFLMPYELYRLRGRKSRWTHARIDLDKFKQLLKWFYKEIINEIYNITDIDGIKPGDTRHFAIINMFLQGFNPLSIARMAGHDTLTTQGGYFNHSLHYAESFVYHLTQKRLGEKMEKKISGGFIGDKRVAYDRGLSMTYEQLSELRKVDFGYCKDTSSNFPDNCSEDCRSCSYYIFKPSIDQFQKGAMWLTSYSREYGKLIESTIKEIFHIGKLAEKINESKIDAELKIKARYLGALMDHKAIVDAKRLESEMYD